MLMLGDNIFRANLSEAVSRQREDHVEAAFLTEEVPYEKTRYSGVCPT